MEAFVYSSLALLAGPLLARVLARDVRLVAALDGFIVSALIGLVVVHILPHSVVEAGPLALATFAVGLGVPLLWERVVKRVAGGSVDVLFAFFVVGGAAHGLLDGAAIHEHAPHDGLDAHTLQDAHGTEGLSSLALGVVLHRLPVGLALYTLVRPLFGGVRTVALGLLYLGSTAAGSVEAMHTLVEESGLALGAMNALVAGSLLHGIVLHRPEVAPTTRGRATAASGVGGLVAIVFIALFTLAHPVHAVVVDELAPGVAFRVLLVATAPAFAAGLVAAGALYALLGTRAHVFTRARRESARLGRAFIDALLGALEGMPYPLCSCSVSSLFRGLARTTLPSSSAVAFTIAASAISAPALFVTAALFDWRFALVRALSVLVVAMVSGALVGRFLASRRRDIVDDALAPCEHHAPGRLVDGLRYGFIESVDHMGPWFALGLGAAALLDAMLPPSLLAALPAVVVVVVMSLVGAPFSLCAAGLTPVALVLAHKGMSDGAVLALLLTGPALQLGTLHLLRDLHGRRAATFWGGTVISTSALVALVADQVGVDAARLDLHGESARIPALAPSLVVLALAVLAVSSVLRQGVRGVLEQIIGRHDHAHDVDGHCIDETRDPSSGRGSPQRRTPLVLVGARQRASARTSHRLERAVSHEPSRPGNVESPDEKPSARRVEDT